MTYENMEECGLIYHTETRQDQRQVSQSSVRSRRADWDTRLIALKHEKAEELVGLTCKTSVAAMSNVILATSTDSVDASTLGHLDGALGISLTAKPQKRTLLNRNAIN